MTDGLICCTLAHLVLHLHTYGPLVMLVFPGYTLIITACIVTVFCSASQLACTYSPSHRSLGRAQEYVACCVVVCVLSDVGLVPWLYIRGPLHAGVGAFKTASISLRSLPQMPQDV